MLEGIREGGRGKGEGADLEEHPASRFPLPPSRASLPTALRTAALRLLAAAKSGPATRDTALTLLAADALMTFACEAVAEREPEALGVME